MEVILPPPVALAVSIVFPPAQKEAFPVMTVVGILLIVIVPVAFNVQPPPVSGML
jgi:hypothetical protein